MGPWRRTAHLLHLAVFLTVVACGKSRTSQSEEAVSQPQPIASDQLGDPTETRPPERTAIELRVVVEPSDLVLGQEAEVRLTLLYSDGTEESLPTPYCASSDLNVLTFASEIGYVQAIGRGSAKLTCWRYDLMAQISLKVVDPQPPATQEPAAPPPAPATAPEPKLILEPTSGAAPLEVDTFLIAAASCPMSSHDLTSIDLSTDWGDGQHGKGSHRYVAAGTFSACSRTECIGRFTGKKLLEPPACAAVVVRPAARAAIRIAVGRAHVCALLDGGSAYCWGENDQGQADGKPGQPLSQPVLVDTGGPVSHVTTGDDHTCAILDDQQVACWGKNERGQLGRGMFGGSAGAVATVPALDKVVDLSAGGAHTCAVLEDGTVHCWGANQAGQLGDGTTVDRAGPVAVSNLTEVVRIAAGGNHSCALHHSGTVSCWGRNANGQLGNGSNGDSTTAVEVTGMQATLVSVGEKHSCAVDRQDSVWCWGANDAYQLGTGETKDSSQPVQPIPSVNATRLAAGEVQTCAHRANDFLSCWGKGFAEQPLVHTSLGPPRVAAASVRSSRTCVIFTGGLVRCSDTPANEVINFP
ncbi:MAG: hypothetical protein HYY13_03770 [Nitrospirae bacterium]|nr:hypothetical protein [Nitrospirota bacterium]